MNDSNTRIIKNLKLKKEIGINFIIKSKETTLTIVRLHLLGSCYFFNNFWQEYAIYIKYFYHRETHQMPGMIKQKALRLEPVLESYGACKFSH